MRASPSIPGKGSPPAAAAARLRPLRAQRAPSPTRMAVAKRKPAAANPKRKPAAPKPVARRKRKPDAAPDTQPDVGTGKTFVEVKTWRTTYYEKDENGKWWRGNLVNLGWSLESGEVEERWKWALTDKGKGKGEGKDKSTDKGADKGADKGGGGKITNNSKGRNDHT